MSVVSLINSGHWVFAGVDGRYSIALCEVVKSRMEAPAVQLCGPFHDRAHFLAARDHAGEVTVSLLRAGSPGGAFPHLPDGMSAEVFARLREAPRLDSPDQPWIFRPVAEFHATNDRPIFDAGEGKGRWPVYGGSSFNIWTPETGEVYAWANPKAVTSALQEKRRRQIGLRSSAFYGLSERWAADVKTLPCFAPRIAFRDVTNATNTRTCITGLIPPQCVVVNQAPYLLRVRGDEQDEAFLLGVLSSIPLDWYARRYVELHLNFHIFNGLPVPAVSVDDLRRRRLIHLAGRLAAADNRFEQWATAVGVPVATAGSSSQRADMEAEIDALVAHLYGLERHHVEHIFSTFHRGWDYKPRLEAVLHHFDGLES